jgi:hypothetical protein
VLCSKEVMQQSLGKEKRNLRRFFWVLCFHERSNFEAWELKRNIGRKSKNFFQRPVVDLTLVFFVVVFLGCWCSWLYLLGFVGVPSCDFLGFV